MWRRWLVIIIVAASIVAVLLWSDWPRRPVHSPQNQQPHAEHSTKQSQTHPEETFWERTTDDPIAVFNLLLVAFTGVLAIATIGLGIATYKLWRVSERHAGHMEQSVKATETTANAAIAASSAAETSAQSAAAQVEIARRAFILAHRPRVRVINVSLGYVNRNPTIPIFQRGQTLHARIGLRNIGETDAHVSKFTYRIFITDMGQPDRWPVNPKIIINFRASQQILGPGMGTILEIDDEAVNDPRVGLGDGWEIYVFGRISYLNDLKIGRSTAFCRKCALPGGHRGPRMERVTDSELEYEE